MAWKPSRTPCAPASHLLLLKKSLISAVGGENAPPCAPDSESFRVVHKQERSEGKRAEFEVDMAIRSCEDNKSSFCNEDEEKIRAEEKEMARARTCLWREESSQSGKWYARASCTQEEGRRKETKQNTRSFILHKRLLKCFLTQFKFSPLIFFSTQEKARGASY